MQKESLVYGEACEQRFPGEKESHGSQTVQADQPRPALPDSVSDFAEITTDKPEKSLLAPKPNKAGRNNNGRITTRHQGGGNKRRYRIIDFKRNKDGVPAKVRHHRVRPEPQRAHRASALCGRREALHPASEGPARGRHGHERPRGRHQAGQRPAARVHPRRHARACRRAAAGQGRGHRAFGRHQHPAAWAKRASTPSCACRLRKCAACCSPAAPPSAKWAMRNTPTSRSARPAATAGRASVPPSAAPS